MTDPQQFVAAQIGQQSGAVQPAASEQDIAQAAQSHAGLGVTETDLDAIKAQLAAFQQQLNAQAAAQSSVSPGMLTGSVASLVHYLEGHGDPAALELGADATEAAKAVSEGGNTGALSGIIAKIETHLRRRPPYPWENFHYNNALAIASHLPEVIDRVNDSQAPRPAEKAPAKVVAGSVVG
jgi:hypothetical protein